MNFKLELTDFCRMHRVGKPVGKPAQTGKVKQVIVKFANYGAKLRVMKARTTTRRRQRPEIPGTKLVFILMMTSQNEHGFPMKGVRPGRISKLRTRGCMMGGSM